MSSPMPVDVLGEQPKPEKITVNEPMYSPVVNLSTPEESTKPTAHKLRPHFTLLKKALMIYDIFLEIVAKMYDRIENLAKAYRRTLNFIWSCPILAFPLCSVVMTAAIPIFGFLTFCVLSTLFTFMGFIVVEGSLLIIISVIICAFLLPVIAIAVLIVSLFMLNHYTFHHNIRQY